MRNSVNHELSGKLSKSIVRAQELGEHGIGEKLCEIVLNNGDGNNLIIDYRSFALEVQEYIESILNDFRLSEDVKKIIEEVNENALLFLNDKHEEPINEEKEEETINYSYIPENIEV